MLQEGRGPPSARGKGGILSLGGRVADAGVGEGFTSVGRCVTLGIRNAHIPSRVFCEVPVEENGTCRDDWAVHSCLAAVGERARGAAGRGEGSRHGSGVKGGGGSLHASLHDKPTRLGVTPSIRPSLSSFERMWRRLERARSV